MGDKFHLWILGMWIPILSLKIKDQIGPEKPMLLRALWVYVTEINVGLSPKRGLTVLSMG